MSNERADNSFSVCRLSCFLVVLFGIMGYTVMATASVPVSVMQQGKLLDEHGEPMTGERQLLFEIHDSATDDSVVWSQEVTVGLDDDGFYSVTLGGEDNPLDAQLFSTGEVYLALTVEGRQLEPRLEMSAVPFASRAAAAESVAEGSVDADALASGAVDADALAADAVDSRAVDSIDWGQIEGVPPDIFDTRDTLDELSCNPEQIALYDGGNWGCESLPEYEAGEGLELDGRQFSIAQDQLVECADGACPVAAGGNIYFDGDPDGELGIGKQSIAVCDPGFPPDCSTIDMLSAGSDFGVSGELHVEDDFIAQQTGQFSDELLVGGDMLHVEGDMVADGDLEISGSTELSGPLRLDEQVGVIVDDDPAGVMHLRGETGELSHAPLVLESAGSMADGQAWAIGPTQTVDQDAIDSHEFRFFYTSDVGNEDLTRRSYIDTTGAYFQSSDAGLKDDVELLEDVLDDVRALRPVQYRFEHGGSHEEPTVGFLAQEVEEIFPNLVDYDADQDQYALSYGHFAVLAIRAVQQQQQLIDDRGGEIDRLQGQVRQLEGELDEMSARLETLEQQLSSQ